MSPPTIPEASIGTGTIPVLGMGLAASPLPSDDIVKSAVLTAIKIGYRHFDTASIYQSEIPLGQAIVEAIREGLVGSRAEFFITSKLWGSDAHPGRVLPAIRATLENLKLEYLDLYLIHWPVCLKAGKPELPVKKEDIQPLDMEGVWKEMEECQKLGLAKSIGVCNFSINKLEKLLSFANIPPAVDQVEINPVWRQDKLREFCASKGIHLTAYSPLGGKGTPWGTSQVMDNRVLKEIAEARGKTIAQVCLRWVYEQGVSVLVKSYNESRMKENLEFFNWELKEEDRRKINDIPQIRVQRQIYVSNDGPLKSFDELWDGEI